MKFEDLDMEQQEWIDNLKYGSNTIECDIKDALERAENLDEFRVFAISKMEDLSSEAKGIKEDIESYF